MISKPIQTCSFLHAIPPAPPPSYVSSTAIHKTGTNTNIRSKSWPKRAPPFNTYLGENAWKMEDKSSEKNIRLLAITSGDKGRPISPSDIPALMYFSCVAVFPKFPGGQSVGGDAKEKRTGIVRIFDVRLSCALKPTRALREIPAKRKRKTNWTAKVAQDINETRYHMKDFNLSEKTVISYLTTQTESL